MQVVRALIALGVIASCEFSQPVVDVESERVLPPRPSPPHVVLQDLPTILARIEFHQSENGGRHYDLSIARLETIVCVGTGASRCASERSRIKKIARVPIGSLAAELITWPSRSVQVIGVTVACGICAEAGRSCPCAGRCEPGDIVPLGLIGKAIVQCGVTVIGTQQIPWRVPTPRMK
jgi:hypothetical protein